MGTYVNCCPPTDASAIAPPYRPDEDRDAVDEACVRGGPLLEDDCRGVRHQLEVSLRETVKSCLVLEHDQLRVGLTSHLEPERRLAQVSIADVLTLLLHYTAAVAAAKDQPTLCDFREESIGIALAGQLVQAGVLLAHLGHRGG